MQALLSTSSHCDFNPRSPRGGATAKAAAQNAVYRISIHAPHEGERLLCDKWEGDNGKFQSTLPTRGSDLLTVLLGTFDLSISIHAPHEGERLSEIWFIVIPDLISIHAPHEGERHCAEQILREREGFQSTLPTRGSDVTSHPCASLSCGFQSTLPTRGSDERRTARQVIMFEFQSTLPTRGSDLMPSKTLL